MDMDKNFFAQHKFEHLLDLKAVQKCTTNITLRQFTTLGDILRNPDDTVTVQSACEPNKNNEVNCTLSIAGIMHITCQRCLELMFMPVDIVLLWYLSVATKDSIEAMERPHREFIDFHEYQGIYHLIEQELLLAVPIVPKHSLQECAVKNIIMDTDEIQRNQEQKNSAFDVLQTLKLK